MEMILNGPNLGNCGRGIGQASLTLAQLACFNAVKKARPNTATIEHSKERETPLPVYVGLTVLAQTRKKELVDSMFTLGLIVSYSRVLEISTELASKACSQFQRGGVVCPMKLRSGLFTTAAVNNLDHNPSATSATDAFHGTAISLFSIPLIILLEMKEHVQMHSLSQARSCRSLTFQNSTAVFLLSP